MKGKVSDNGIICGSGKLFPYSWGPITMNDGPETLFALSSWSRVCVKDYINREVRFDVTYTGKAYNIGLIDKDNKIIGL